MFKKATEADLLSLIELAERLDPAVKKAWKIASLNPQALYRFMQGFVAFNFYAAPSATILAANLKLMDMNDAASAVFAALPDEYGKFPAAPDHRTLACGLLSVTEEYATLSSGERNQSLPDWHMQITKQLQCLYQGKAGDRQALIRALGAHWASELLADREYAEGDRIVRQEAKGQGFDGYLRENYLKNNHCGHDRYEMKFGQWRFDPWFWIKTHGEADKHAAEYHHFLHAQEAVNIVLKNPSPDSYEQVWEWIKEGALEFADLQNRFFTNIAEECKVVVDKTGREREALAG